MMNELIRIKDAEFGLEELANFLVEAKRTCYAGNGNEQVLADCSKQLTFQKGNFHYTDNYAGYFQAPGTEIVRWQKPEGQRLWQMSYSGGMNPGFYNPELAKETFAFLKQALSQVPVHSPFRGPISTRGFNAGPVFWDDTFEYSAEVNGDIKDFDGVEEIRHKEHGPVFRQNYIGGLVIPK